MNREEHLQWAKKRALEYVALGQLPNAWSSFLSDMQKHDETKNHIGLELGARMMASGNLDTQSAMKKFIEDFE